MSGGRGVGKGKAAAMDHIKALTPLAKNPRKHNQRSIGEIADSLQAVGAARSVVIDEDGNVLAGNGTIEAAGQVGITKLMVVDADGQTIVAVRRSGLTEAQKVEIAIRDNRAGEHSGWDAATFKALIADYSLDANALGFRDHEMALLLGEMPDPANNPDEEWKGMPGCDNQDLSAWKSLRVNFASAESLKAFAALLGQPLTENTRSIWYPAAEIGTYADKRYASDES